MRTSTTITPSPTAAAHQATIDQARDRVRRTVVSLTESGLLKSHSSPLGALRSRLPSQKPVSTWSTPLSAAAKQRRALSTEKSTNDNKAWEKFYVHTITKRSYSKRTNDVWMVAGNSTTFVPTRSAKLLSGSMDKGFSPTKTFPSNSFSASTRRINSSTRRRVGGIKASVNNHTESRSSAYNQTSIAVAHNMDFLADRNYVIGGRNGSSQHHVTDSRTRNESKLGALEAFTLPLRYELPF